MSTPMPEHGPMWRDAHETARALHDALLAIGIPETVLGPLTARSDGTGRPRTVIPPLPLEDARRLLAALGPYLGPQFIGRRGVPPIAPAATAAVPPAGIR